MGLAIALIGMTALAIALLVVPLVRRRQSAEARDAYSLAVYRDQLAEIERDLARGVVEPVEAEAARAEIGRRLLALSPTAAAAVPPSALPLAIATIAVITLPFAAGALYWQLGSPSLPDQPYAARRSGDAPAAAEADRHIDLGEAIRRLNAHLQLHPDDLDGWMLLARSLLDRGQYQAAADAYQRAAGLSGQRPDIVGDWGEAQVWAAGGTVTEAARRAFETALADRESAPRSRYYFGLAELQQGNAKDALQGWVDLEADSPDDAAWLPILRRHIAEAAQAAGIDPATLKTSSGASRKPPQASAEPPPGMPSGAAVAAAANAIENASPEARQAMIQAMVEQLAARLAKEPDDAAGWSQLGRSYMVLNEPDNARDAYAHAARLLPGDIAVKERYAEAIIAATANGDDRPPELAASLLRDVLAANPQNRKALWYVGLAEAEAGHAEAAFDLWTRLLAILPTDAPERREVEQRLVALNRGGAK